MNINSNNIGVGTGPVVQPVGSAPVEETEKEGAQGILGGRSLTLSSTPISVGEKDIVTAAMDAAAKDRTTFGFFNRAFKISLVPNPPAEAAANEVGGGLS